MKNDANSTGVNDLAMKLIAGLFILICLAVGLVGLILPIIPGLLFLAIAAMIAAKFFPKIDAYLRKSPMISRYLDSGRGFSQLSIWGKVQYSCWLCIKVFIDSIICTIALIVKAFSFGRARYQRH